MLKKERVKALRKKMVKTQQELASEIGVHLSTYNEWEQGKGNPTIDKIQAMAIALKTSIDYIVGNTNIVSSAPRESLTLLDRNGIKCKIARFIEEDSQNLSVDVISEILNGKSLKEISNRFFKVGIPEEKAEREKLEKEIFDLAKLAVYENRIQLEISEDARDKDLEKELMARFSKTSSMKYSYNLLHNRILKNPIDESFEFSGQFMPIIMGELAKGYFLEVLENPSKVYGPDTNFTINSIGVVSGYYVERLFKSISYSGIKDILNTRKIKILPMCIEPSMGQKNLTYGNYIVADFVYRMLHKIGGDILHPIGDMSMDVFQLNSKYISEVIYESEKVDIVFCGVGNLAFAEPGTIFNDVIKSAGFDSNEDLMKVSRAVGDFMFHLLDEDGNIKYVNLLEAKYRYIGVTPENIRTKANHSENWRPVVCISSGKRRKDIMLATLRGKFINTLLIDDVLAKALIEIT